jgi:hypothetical protein
VLRQFRARSSGADVKSFDRSASPSTHPPRGHRRRSNPASASGQRGDGDAARLHHRVAPASAGAGRGRQGASSRRRAGRSF